MTTYLSIPGRLLVMMPGMSRLGVSRKIEDDQAREKARTILADLKPPPDIGFIVRTAAIERPKREFQRDLNYLLRLWKSVKLRIQNSKAPAEIYQESDLVTRTIRDVYNTDITRIICDNQEVAVKAKEFLDVAMPRTKNIIDLYVGKEGLFQEYGLEQEIEKIYARRLELPSGGSLVFDQAEALVAIDVNSGRFREHSDAETTATKINQEAARQIARQLRLRDLGGVVIVDFIDMREERNRRSVEKVLRDEMRNDRAKAKVLKISNFGIVEMTRQRVRPSLKQSIFRTCPHCEGTALIKNEESQALLVMRNLQRACSNELVAQVEVTVTPSVEHHLSNFERKRISDLETQFGKKIIIKSDPALSGSEVKINCVNSRSSVVAWEQPPKPGPAHAANPPTVSLDQVVPPSPSKLLPGDEDISDDFVEVDEEETEQTPAPQVPQAPMAPSAPAPRVSAPPAPRVSPPQAATANAPAIALAPAQTAQVPHPAAQQQVQAARPALATGSPALPAGAPGAPGEGPQSAIGPDGKRRRRGRRGGRKHRARRERQALAQQQGLPQGAPGVHPAAEAPFHPSAPAGIGATPAAASPAPAQGMAEPHEEPVPSYERDSRGQAASLEPSEEDEISEAREMAIEQQDQEEAQEEVQAEVVRPSQPPAKEEPAPAQSPAASAELPEVPAQAQEPAPEGPAKKRRRRGGRRHSKNKGNQQAPSETAAQAPENVNAAPDVPAGQASPQRAGRPSQTRERVGPQKQVRAAAPPPPPASTLFTDSTAEPVPSAPSKADQVASPTPETAAPAAPAAGRKTRVRPKKASHRQDKEYYEETLRRQKEAVTKPKDAIPDDEEEDFSTE
jgi:Rne/Rng family ribonuclease